MTLTVNFMRQTDQGQINCSSYQANFAIRIRVYSRGFRAIVSCQLRRVRILTVYSMYFVYFSRIVRPPSRSLNFITLILSISLIMVIPFSLLLTRTSVYQVITNFITRKVQMTSYSMVIIVNHRTALIIVQHFTRTFLFKAAVMFTQIDPYQLGFTQCFQTMSFIKVVAKCFQINQRIIAKLIKVVRIGSCLRIDFKRPAAEVAVNCFRIDFD